MGNVTSTAYPIIDCHIHYGHPEFMPGLMKIVDQFKIDRINIVCTPHINRVSLTPDALHLKAHYPERVYVFGGLDVSHLFINPGQAGAEFANYVDTLAEMGCDGVKMIEGKPEMRKTLPIPDFDGPIYAPYWQKMEETEMPLLFHVNDPEEFWSAERIPQWAKERGWFYGDGIFINNEDQYRQILNVLERHPKLKVIFAHFFFFSAQLPRLAEYLDRYPNMCVDLTPGIEMYHNFSKNPDATRDFFIKYQDRILYGTDIGAKALLFTPEKGIEADESQARIDVVRSFLELDKPYTLEKGAGFLFGNDDVQFHGIGLPPETLEKIYFKNFERIAGKKPRQINAAAIITQCSRIEATLSILDIAQPNIPHDKSIIKMVMDYFLNPA
jgi:predicted TIM-barrel fold metal-dependent hydrolase